MDLAQAMAAESRRASHARTEARACPPRHTLPRGSAQCSHAGRHTQEGWLTPPRSQAEAPAARLGHPCHPLRDVASLPFCSLLSLPLEVKPPELSWRAELAHMAGNMMPTWASTHWGPHSWL